MESKLNAIVLMSTTVIILLVTISTSAMKEKVYTVAMVSIFTTVVIGLFISKNSIMDTNNVGWHKRIALYIALCLTVIVPQLKYANIVSKKSQFIVSPTQLPYNGTIVSLSLATMVGVIGGIHIAGNKESSAQQGILLKSLIGCMFFGGLSYALVKIMEERLNKMNANSLSNVTDPIFN
jgi:hypothetical protein